MNFFGFAYTVQQNEVAIIERLGKFHSATTAGLHFKIPVADAIRSRLNTQIQQVSVELKAKTKDNIFITVPIVIQYEIVPDRAREAFYSLSNPVQQIEAYVMDAVRTPLASLTVDEAYNAKDNISLHVEEYLSEKMKEFGWNIRQTLIPDIQIPQALQESWQSVITAENTKQAALALAAANKTKVIAAAEADAEARRLQGLGAAQEREELAKGMANSYAILAEAEANPDVAATLLSTQYVDMLKSVGANGKNTVIMMPSNVGAVSHFTDELRNSIMQANIASDSM